MLHSLWILLKFILILLGILLGLILVAVLLILFCPVRYRASGAKETDSFKKRFISMLARLKESDWEVLERMVAGIKKD